MSFFGIGDLVVETLNPIASLGHTALFELCITQLATASNPTETRSQCRDPKSGQLVTKRKSVGEVIHTVTITATHYDWQSLGFFHGEIPTDVARDINKNVRVTVPAGLTITDTEIDATNADTVRAYVTEKGTWGDAQIIKIVSAAPTSKYEVQVDGATSTITFHADLEGASIIYKYKEAYAPIQSIGATDTFERYGDLEMWYTAKGEDDFSEGVVYHFPKLVASVTPPTIDFSQSPATISVSFEASGNYGRGFPYELYNPELAIAA